MAIRRTARVKTPTVLQMEAAECGAAALGIVLAYYGRIVPLAELRQECGVSRDGSRASNMLKAARKYGLIAKGFSRDLQGVQTVKRPCIVFWNFNHFLVVEGFRHGRVQVNDPATGPRTISMQEFDEGYTGLVLVLEPGSEFKQGGRKPSTITALRSRLTGSVDALVMCIAIGFLLVLPNLAIAAFARVFVDNILIQRMHDWLRPLVLGVIFTALIRTLLSRMQLAHLRRLRINLAATMGGRFMWHILRLPASFYAQRYAGEIGSRLNLNVRIAEILSGRLATTAIDVVTMAFYVAVMIQYDVLLTVIGLSFAALNFVALQHTARLRKDANRRALQEQGKVSGPSIAALQGIETLKASALESDFFARWAGYYARALDAQQSLSVLTQRLVVVPPFLFALASMFILAVGALRVMDGALTIGMLVAFQSLMHSFLAPVGNLVDLGATLQDLEGDLARLDDVLQNPVDPDTANPPLETTPETSRLQGHIEFQNVTFGFNRLAPPLIDNFNLRIRPGQRVALVGPSGSGKSTLIKLLCGLYQPWEGTILFDGQPRTRIPREVLTDSISLVEQDVVLFAGSVRQNLTLWDSTLPDARLMRACQDAAIYDVVRSLAGGFDAQLIEGGANLSGGERQRLEIARALVHDPTILITDEATSALDPEVEETIGENLRRRGCSTVLVAHRLSTIRDCDEIIVLQRGSIVERGTHDMLMRQRGAYAQLIASEGGVLPGQ